VGPDVRIPTPENNQQRYYKEEFYAETANNKEQIYQKLNKIVFLQIQERLNKTEAVSKGYFITLSIEKSFAPSSRQQNKMDKMYHETQKTAATVLSVYRRDLVHLRG